MPRPPASTRHNTVLKTDLDTLTARSHHLDQLTRRTLGVVAGLASLRNGNRRQLCRGPRRCPSVTAATQAPGGGEGRSGAERRCVIRFSGTPEGAIPCKSTAKAPRSAPFALADSRDFEGGVSGPTSRTERVLCSILSTFEHPLHAPYCSHEGAIDAPTSSLAFSQAMSRNPGAHPRSPATSTRLFRL
ncbi:hypothetical protein GGG16DRAFT_119649 [Schizophyllum commune]